MSEKAKREVAQPGGLGRTARATYEIAASRRQRDTQYKRQMQVFLVVIGLALIGGALAAYLSWHGVGSTKEVSCTEYETYCVPLVGGGPVAALESADSRTLDGESSAEASVVRGVTDEGVPFIGNPDAPIKIAAVADYACSHCQDYHSSDLHAIVRDYVLTGQAQLQVVLTTGTGGVYSQLASLVALCAGEQGAFWEMNDELYRMAEAQSVVTAFDLSNLLDAAGDMGLDEDALRQCYGAGTYSSTLSAFATFANDNGVTGTPSVLVNVGDGWRIVSRDYVTIASLVERAHGE
ncbi:DsbA family protein [Aggregatilinea lenta]|uniref:DsbA family protein n=1 Tax=Aggregatilinea lenta TaxID=913108 RepID=UPI0013C33726|nr:thioredoxin domain-containing protein [Aggregatilinea lenta]